MRFEPKNLKKKKGSFGVFRSALKRFGFLFYDSDDAQNHQLAAQLDAPGAAAFKKDNFMENKFAFRAKKRQKNGFFGFSGLH